MAKTPTHNPTINSLKNELTISAFELRTNTANKK